MATIAEDVVLEEKNLADIIFSTEDDAEAIQALVKASNKANPLLLPSQVIVHNPKAGLNPLVDAAAYLFSIIGKLKEIKTYRHLNKLRKELIQEISHFQDTAKGQGYCSEYILVSRYALCATLDDLILNTSWGIAGQWENDTLLSAFNQETLSQDRFFVILDRLVKDPVLYIDVMEFMYICLSLGFKGPYRTSESGNHQLEQIIDALYKRIRTYRGDFSKMLSPTQTKHTTTTHKPSAKMPTWIISLLVVGISLTLFAGMRYLLNTTSTQAYLDLTRTGKTTTYENHDQTVE